MKPEDIFLLSWAPPLGCLKLLRSKWRLSGGLGPDFSADDSIAQARCSVFIKSCEATESLNVASSNRLPDSPIVKF